MGNRSTSTGHNDHLRWQNAKNQHPHSSSCYKQENICSLWKYAAKYHIFRRKIYGIYKEMFHNNQNIVPHRLTISNQSFHVVSPWTWHYQHHLRCKLVERFYKNQVSHFCPPPPLNGINNDLEHCLPMSCGSNGTSSSLKTINSLNHFKLSL